MAPPNIVQVNNGFMEFSCIPRACLPSVPIDEATHNLNIEYLFKGSPEAGFLREAFYRLGIPDTTAAELFSSVRRPEDLKVLTSWFNDDNFSLLDGVLASIIPHRTDILMTILEFSRLSRQEMRKVYHAAIDVFARVGHRFPLADLKKWMTSTEEERAFFAVKEFSLDETMLEDARAWLASKRGSDEDFASLYSAVAQHLDQHLPPVMATLKARFGQPYHEALALFCLCEPSSQCRATHSRGGNTQDRFTYEEAEQISLWLQNSGNVVLLDRMLAAMQPEPECEREHLSDVYVLDKGCAIRHLMRMNPEQFQEACTVVDRLFELTQGRISSGAVSETFIVDDGRNLDEKFVNAEYAAKHIGPYAASLPFEYTESNEDCLRIIGQIVPYLMGQNWYKETRFYDCFEPLLTDSLRIPRQSLLDSFNKYIQTQPYRMISCDDFKGWMERSGYCD